MAEKARSNERPLLPPVVYAEASVRSAGGVSLFEVSEHITSETVSNFYSDPQLVELAVEKLRKEGFEVLLVGSVTISISAPLELYEQVFKTKIVAEEREVIKEFGKKSTATFLECPETPVSGLIDSSKSSLADVLEGVALSEPVYYFESASPPLVEYWHLDVPDDVAEALNVSRNVKGRNIKVVMVDSGWYRHPFFDHHGNCGNVVLAPGVTDPEHDEHGHGTGESANLFAVAPEIDFTMVKMDIENSVAAFKAAVSLNPDIISCSWGQDVQDGPLSSYQQSLAGAVADAVHKGIIVVFAAGNGSWAFPAQHPDVIAVGGVYMHPDGSLQATPYASGFESKIYPDRIVPDVCGLVGLPSGDPQSGRSPGAMYIMLPIEPNCYLDEKCWNYGAKHYRSPGASPPYGDETAKDDGWAAFSGTSAAAPQVAGVCALMKQVGPSLTPFEVCDILKNTARDITEGSCHQDTGGHSATPGPDLATGHGLVDASKVLPDVFLRDYVGDTGAPHTELNIGYSPDIIVRPNPVTNPQTAFGEGSGTEDSNTLGSRVEAGQPNYVYARVRNRGALIAKNVVATIYWSDFSTLVTPDSWHLVGSETIPEVATGNVLAVSDAIVWEENLPEETGVRCFVGLIDTDGDPAPDPFAVSDMDDFIHLIRAYNNVTWRNFDVVDNEPDQDKNPEYVVLPFYVTGPPDKTRQMWLEVVAELPEGAYAWLEVRPNLIDGFQFRDLGVDKKRDMARLPINPQGSTKLRARFRPKSKSLARLLVHIPEDKRDNEYEIFARQLYQRKEVGRVIWHLVPRDRLERP